MNPVAITRAHWVAWVDPVAVSAEGSVRPIDTDSAAPAKAVPSAEPIWRTVLCVADAWPDDATVTSRSTVPVGCAEARQGPTP